MAVQVGRLTIDQKITKMIAEYNFLITGSLNDMEAN